MNGQQVSNIPGYKTASNVGRGVVDYVKNNPDTIAMMAAPFMPRGWRAPMAALGGVAEIAKYPGRVDVASSPTESVTVYDPGDIGVDVPSAGKTTKIPSRTIGGEMPRDRNKAVAATMYYTHQLAREDKESEEREVASMRSRRPQLPSPPGLITSPSGKILQGRTAQPSLEQIAKLLVMRGGRLGPMFPEGG